MKKIISFGILFFLSCSSIFATYTPSYDDLRLFDAAKVKIIDLYDKDINKAYSVVNNINSFFTKYKNSESGTYLLNFINNLTIDYIKNYETKIKENTQNEQDKDKQQEEQEVIQEQTPSQTLPNFSDVIDAQNKKLAVLSKEGIKTIASISMEPKNDHLYLKNVYLENIGTVKELSYIIQEVYLVDSNDRIITKGYVSNNYLVFDVGDNYIIQQDKFINLYIKAILRQPSNENQIGELEFELNTPSNAQVGTLNGIRATSYSNGNYITVNKTTNNNSIVTLLTYNDTNIMELTDFEPSYTETMGFRLYNNSNSRMTVKSFEIRLGGSFLSYIDLNNTKLILRHKGTNQIFGSEFLNVMNTSSNLITIPFNGNSFNDFSPNMYVDYILEIEHSGNPEGSREIRLNNITISDGFGGTITNLNDYSNTGLPTKVFSYRY